MRLHTEAERGRRNDDSTAIAFFAAGTMEIDGLNSTLESMPLRSYLNPSLTLLPLTLALSVSQQ
jgi:hypothetical protein